MKKITQLAAVAISLLSITLPSVCANGTVQGHYRALAPGEVSPAASSPYISDLTGFFGGIQGGTQWSGGKYNVSTTADGAAGVDLGRMGGVGGLFLGYGYMANKVFMALQFQGDIGDFKSTADLQDGTTTNSASLNTSTILGVGALIGYTPIKNLIAYLRLGVDYAKWRYNDNIIGSSNRQALWGFAPGLGMRAMVTNNTFINLEWRTTLFGKNNLSGTNGTSSIRPRTQLFMVGFGFKTK